MANAVRNTLSETGTRSPSTDRMQTANAISVAVGIPQPDAASVPRFTSVYRTAGIITPPNAAITGNSAFLTDDSSPCATSRFISRPTVKKNITMRMSLMNFSMVISCGNSQLMFPLGLWR